MLMDLCIEFLWRMWANTHTRHSINITFATENEHWHLRLRLSDMMTTFLCCTKCLYNIMLPYSFTTLKHSVGLGANWSLANVKDFLFSDSLIHHTQMQFCSTVYTPPSHDLMLLVDIIWMHKLKVGVSLCFLFMIQ